MILLGIATASGWRSAYLVAAAMGLVVATSC